MESKKNYSAEEVMAIYGELNRYIGKCEALKETNMELISLLSYIVEKGNSEEENYDISE